MKILEKDETIKNVETKHREVTSRRDANVNRLQRETAVVNEMVNVLSLR